MPDVFALFKKKKPDSDRVHDDAMPPRPAYNTTGGRTSTTSDPNSVADALGRLSLIPDGVSRRRDARHSTGRFGFVGGFEAPRIDGRSPLGSLSPQPAPHGGAHSTPSFPQPDFCPAPGPLPVPPPPILMQMPVPQTSATAQTSLTMQYAQTLPSGPPPPPKDGQRPPNMPRPKSDSGAFPSSSHLGVPSTPQRPHLQQAPKSAPTKPAVSIQAAPLGTPTKRPRAASSPPSPTASNAGKGGLKVQCSATTKADKRCTRMVAITAPLARLNGEDLPHYCHQHLKHEFEDVKFRSHKNPAEWVYFKDWIPEYLQEETQELLKTEMMTKRSQADELGYIYTFEIDDNSTIRTVHLKVGRAVKLTKRLHEWDKQCQSKQTHLRGFWPSTKDADDGHLARGRVQVGPPGPWCHKVEKLVHLELADLAINAPYLDADFPNVQGGKGNGSSVVRAPCPDCGHTHKEIFSFREARGRYKGREWEDIVKPVIEKWGAFVEAYV